jgi:hypothetical protein
MAMARYLQVSRAKNSPVLYFPAKKLRAQVIANFMRNSKLENAICFSCGNAAIALREELGASCVLEIGDKGQLQTTKWWTPAEIKAVWPNHFDATSGHLPLFLMVSIAKAFREHLGELKEPQYTVASGSGETIICLQMAYPACTFVAVYDNSNQATTRDNDAPLNSVVDGQFAVEYWHNQLDLR